MDLEIRPSAYYSADPFRVKIAYNETVENLIYMISLSLVSADVTKMELVYRGKRLLPVTLKLNEVGITNGESVELTKASSKCCEIL